MLLFTFLSFLSFLAFSSAYTPGSCSGYCDAIDPSLIRRELDGKYFRFGTGTGVPIASSYSIQGPWAAQGEVLNNGSSIKIDGVDSENIWVCIYHITFGSYGTNVIIGPRSP